VINDENEILCDEKIIQDSVKNQVIEQKINETST